MRFSCFAILGALLAPAAPAAAQSAVEPVRMAPSSDWVVDYAPESCALRRAFRSGEEQAILEFRLYAPGEHMEVVVVSDTIPRTRQPPRVRFEPDDAWYEPAAPLFVDTGARHGVLYTDSLRPNELKPEGQPWPAWPDQDRDAREQAITRLAVSGSFDRDVTLETGKMHQPMEAMRACVQELVTHWNLDPVVPGPLARGARPLDMEYWARKTMDNYPDDMVRAGKSGRVSVRLIVGKDGKPRSCHPNGLAEPSFLEAACRSLQRYARFEPALDGAGEPVADTFVTTVVYQMEH